MQTGKLLSRNKGAGGGGERARVRRGDRRQANLLLDVLIHKDSYSYSAHRTSTSFPSIILYCNYIVYICTSIACVMWLHDGYTVTWLCVAWEDSARAAGMLMRENSASDRNSQNSDSRSAARWLWIEDRSSRIRAAEERNEWGARG